MPSNPFPKPDDPFMPGRKPAQALATGSWLPLAGLLAVASALAALLGYGLAVSVQQALAAASVGLVGAVVGAVVAAVALPLALRGRLPQAAVWRRRVLSPCVVSAAPAAASVTAPVASPKVVNLHASSALARAQAARPVAPKLSRQSMAESTQPARDALTGAYTQPHFVAAADREWSRIRRHGGDAAMLMVDVDHFKAVNQQFGQEAGDALLVELTRQVSATLRQYDLLARFGGGVLVVYLPHTDPIGALDVAERIRERVMAVRLKWQDHSIKASVSVGVTGIGVAHGLLEDVIADAGAALREAKAAGRNCVRAAPIAPRHHAADGHDPGSRRPAGPF